MVMAIPDAAGPAAKRSAWKSATVQNELGSWATRLTELGWPVTKDELEERMWVVATSWTRVAMALRKPLRPYTKWVGVGQRWRMFVAPHRHPATLYIEIRRNRQWVPVYVARSSELDWNAHQLDHTRTRSMLFRYAWKEYRRHYRAFAFWVARQLAEDFPDSQGFRFKWYRFRTPSPEEVREDRIPEGNFVQGIVIRREELQ